MTFKKLEIPENKDLYKINDIMEDITRQMHKHLTRQVEDAFIQGLKNKGFEFKRGSELETFVKERCRCEDNVQLKQKVYFVDDAPFFLHNYEMEIITDPRKLEHSNIIEGSYGSYTYL